MSALAIALADPNDPLAHSALAAGPGVRLELPFASAFAYAFALNAGPGNLPHISTTTFRHRMFSLLRSESLEPPIATALASAGMRTGPALSPIPATPVSASPTSIASVAPRSKSTSLKRTDLDLATMDINMLPPLPNSASGMALAREALGTQITPILLMLSQLLLPIPQMRPKHYNYLASSLRDESDCAELVRRPSEVELTGPEMVTLFGYLLSLTPEALVQFQKETHGLSENDLLDCEIDRHTLTFDAAGVPAGTEISETVTIALKGGNKSSSRFTWYLPPVEERYDLTVETPPSGRLRRTPFTFKFTLTYRVFTVIRAVVMLQVKGGYRHFFVINTESRTDERLRAPRPESAWDPTSCVLDSAFVGTAISRKQSIPGPLPGQVRASGSSTSLSREHVQQAQAPPPSPVHAVPTGVTASRSGVVSSTSSGSFQSGALGLRRLHTASSVPTLYSQSEAVEDAFNSTSTLISSMQAQQMGEVIEHQQQTQMQQHNAAPLGASSAAMPSVPPTTPVMAPPVRMGGSSSPPPSRKVPKGLAHLRMLLQSKQGLMSIGIFREKGTPWDVSTLHTKTHAGVPWDCSDVHAIATCIKLLLRETLANIVIVSSAASATGVSAQPQQAPPSNSSSSSSSSSRSSSGDPSHMPAAGSLPPPGLSRRGAVIDAESLIAACTSEDGSWATFSGGFDTESDAWQVMLWALDLMAVVALHRPFNQMGIKSVATAFAPNLCTIDSTPQALKAAQHLVQFLSRVLERHMRELGMHVELARGESEADLVSRQSSLAALAAAKSPIQTTATTTAVAAHEKDAV